MVVDQDQDVLIAERGDHGVQQLHGGAPHQARVGGQSLRFDDRILKESVQSPGQTNTVEAEVSNDGSNLLQWLSVQSCNDEDDDG